MYGYPFLISCPTSLSGINVQMTFVIYRRWHGEWRPKFR